jgi:alpha-N-arabinofuranosidase
VVTRPDQLDYNGIASSGGLYAPTLRYHDGQFWVVCTLVDQNDPARGGNFLMTATNPAGPWSDPVWLDADGIDPSVFFDEDGRVWLHGTRLAREPQWHHQTEVWLREYDPALKVLAGPEHVIWKGAVLGAVWAEGPHLYRVDGTYYLLAAEGGTEIHHAVSIARSSTVTGPYKGCQSNPVLTHRHLGRGADVVGAGHADLVQAVDGSWWAVLLAMRRYGGYHYPLGRETFVVPVSWEDGWPVFAPGIGRIPDEVEVPFAGSSPVGTVQGGGGGLVLPDDPRWTSLRGPAADFVAARGEGLSLRLSDDSLADPTTPAFVGIRQQHRRLDFLVTLRAALVRDEETGLVIRQSERDHLRLAVLTGLGGEVVVRAVHRKAGVDEVLGEFRPDAVVGASLRLAVRVRDEDYRLTVSTGDAGETSVATADGRELDSVATGGFLGLWLGVYGTSAGAVSSTVVEIDRVDYQPV